MSDNFDFQDFQTELDTDGMTEEEETEEDELKGAGMHVEGGDDDEVPEMESDL